MQQKLESGSRPWFKKAKMGGSAMRKLAPLAIVVVLALACVASANLLLNPGFETATGGTGMQGNTPTNWWGWQHGGSEGWAARSGANGIAFWSWDNGEYCGFGQDVYSNMIPGDVITFSVWGRAETGFASTVSEMWLQLELWDNGSIVQKVTNSIYSLMTSGGLGNGQWTQMYIGITNSLSGVDLIKPMVGGGGFTNRQVNGQSVMWDDADFTIAIPEPTMAALLGFSGLIFLAARRMVRK
jgi:hypothetical protein